MKGNGLPPLRGWLETGGWGVNLNPRSSLWEDLVTRQPEKWFRNDFSNGIQNGK